MTTDGVDWTRDGPSKAPTLAQARYGPGSASEPSYRSMAASGELERRARRAQAMLGRCNLCGHACLANRLEGPLGPCKTGRFALVSSYFPHFGEEPPLVGSHGSGTIFFSWCNLACLYCQNYELSQLGWGRATSEEELADMMLHLQRVGCHNINLVSPSHVLPQILGALAIATEEGLSLPLVYNTGGYDSLPALRLLDGIVDIYMPDMKYSDAALAQELSGIRAYPQVNRKVVLEMHRQVGDLVIDRRGVAVRGLLVRHLVLPSGLSGTGEVIRFIAERVSRGTYLNLMDQYRPCHLAWRRPPLDRRLSSHEYAGAVELARRAGLWRGIPFESL